MDYDFTLTGFVTAVQEIASLKESLTEARRVLREVEWRGGYLVEFNGEAWIHACCPMCNADDVTSHATDCALAAVLAQEETR